MSNKLNDGFNAVLETNMLVVEDLEIVDKILGNEIYLHVLNALNSFYTLLENDEWYENLHHDMKICLLEGIERDLFFSAKKMFDALHLYKETTISNKDKKQINKFVNYVETNAKTVEYNKIEIRKEKYPKELENMEKLDDGESMDSPLFQGDISLGDARAEIMYLLEHRHLSLVHSFVGGLAANAGDDKIFADLVTNNSSLTSSKKVQEEMLYDLRDTIHDNNLWIEILIQNAMGIVYDRVVKHLVSANARTDFTGANSIFEALGTDKRVSPPFD